MLPNVFENIKDGGLGLATPANSGVFGIEGNASSGDVEKVYVLGDPATAEDTFGAGSMLERILDAFANGATRIKAIRTDPTGGTAAANGTVTHKVSGTSTGAVTLTGTAVCDRDFKLIITDDGATGAIAGGGVKIKISVNEGITYGDEIALPAASPQTIALGNGCSVVLTDNATPAGSFVVDDYWTWSSSEAKPTTQNKLDAIEILAADDEIAWIHSCDATDNTFWASISSFNAELILKHRYITWILEADRPGTGDDADDWVADLNSSAAAYFDHTVNVCAGWGLFTDRNGVAVIRNGAGVIDGLGASANVQESIGWVGGFPISNMLAIYPTDMTDAHVDSIDQARFTTFRFWSGHGFRVTNARMMATLTSDFRYWETVRTMYKAVKMVRAAAIPFVQAGADAAGLIAYQKALEAPLDRMKTDGECVGYELLIPSGQDIIGTGEVKAQLTIIPVGIMRILTITFGLGKAKA